MKKLLVLLLLSISALGQTIQAPGGVVIVGTTPVSATVVSGARVSGILPYESVNFFQRNAPAQPLTGLFTNTKGTDDRPKASGQLFANFSSIYEYPDGTNATIDSLRFYLPYGGDGFANDEFYFYATDRATGIESLIWQTSASLYKGVEVKYKLPSSVNPKSIRFYVVNNANPIYLKIIGSYNVVPAYAYPTPTIYPLVSEFGTVMFHYDLTPTETKRIDTSRFNSALALGGDMRHYYDWKLLEPGRDTFYFNPTPYGGWYMDSVYQRTSAYGLNVYPCLKTVPNWMLSSYPDSLNHYDPVKKSYASDEFPPAYYGSDLEVPAVYSLQARAAFQIVARWGHNTNIPQSSILTYTGAQGTYPGAPADQKKVGLGYIKWIECDNERDKWWKGIKQHQTGRQFAANLSAFYDGHKGTLGAGYGAKTADPTIKVILGGIAQTKPDYLHDFVTWCRDNRGYKTDGSLDLPIDMVAFHIYLGNLGGQDQKSTFGINVEDSYFLTDFPPFQKYVQRYMNNIPILINESGYDSQAKGSSYGIPAIAGKDTLETHADWLMRQWMVFNRYGIQSNQNYLFRTPGVGGIFGTSGLLNYDYSRRPIVNYVVQLRKLVPSMLFTNVVEESATTYAYQYSDLSTTTKPRYALWSPTRVNRTATYTLSVPGATSVSVYKLAPYAQNAIKTTVTGSGSFVIPISETPVIVIPSYATSALTMPYDSIIGFADSTLSRPDTTIMDRVAVSTPAQFRNLLTTPQTNKYITVADATYNDNGEYQQTANWDNVYVRSKTKGGAKFYRDGYSTLLIFTNTHSIKRTCFDGLYLQSNYASSNLANPIIWNNELVTIDGLEIKNFEIVGNAAGNYNAYGIVQYSTSSQTGAVAKNYFIHANNLHDIPRAGMEIICQKYTGGATLLSNLVITNNIVARTGLGSTYGAGLSFSGSMKNAFVSKNRFLENKFVGLEVVNAINLIARSNEITSLTAVGSGIGISSDGNGGTVNLFFDGDNAVNVLGRGIYGYQAGNVHFAGGTYKGRQRYDFNKLINSSFTGMNLTHWGTAAEYGLVFDAGCHDNTFTNNTLTSAGAAAAGYNPFTRPMQLVAGTYNTTVTGNTFISGKKADGTYYSDGSVLNSGTNNTITPNTISLSN